MNDSVRAFIAIAIPPPIKCQLQEAQEQLRRQIGPDKKIRWSPPEHYHLTLRFLGNVPLEAIRDVEAALKAAARTVEGFTLRIEGCGCFPSCANPRIVWAGIHGEITRLAALQAETQQATAHFGEPPENRAYKPHLTIARVKSDRLAELRHIGLTVREFKLPATEEWGVEEVELIQSELSPQGSSYTTLARAPLSR